jgi:large subunit ribosomal protein L21
MYAIIRAGGKQFKVQAGDTVRVDTISKKLGDEFDMPEVLVVGGDKTFVGQPLVQGAKVSVVVTAHDRASKIVILKKKRRQGYRKMQGHRQDYTELFVKSITTPEGQSTKSDKDAVIVDPVKIQARKDANAVKAKETKRDRTATVEASAKKKTSKKKTAKKAGGKKRPAKKAGAKKAAKKSKSK